MKYLFALMICLIVPQSRADETLFSKAEADGTTLRITLSSPHPNPPHPERKLEPNEHEPEETQTWRAEIVGWDSKVSKVLFEFEDAYFDPMKYTSSTPPPYRILAAKPLEHGVLIVQTKQGYIESHVISHLPEQFEKNPILMEANEKSRGNETKFKATIEGDEASNNITTLITTPDGKTRKFKLTFDKTNSHWDEETKGPHTPTTLESAGPSTRPTETGKGK